MEASMRVRSLAICLSSLLVTVLPALAPKRFIEPAWASHCQNINIPDGWDIQGWDYAHRAGTARGVRALIYVNNINTPERPQWNTVRSIFIRNAPGEELELGWDAGGFNSTEATATRNGLINLFWYREVNGNPTTSARTDIQMPRNQYRLFKLMDQDGDKTWMVAYDLDGDGVGEKVDDVATRFNAGNAQILSERHCYQDSSYADFRYIEECFVGCQFVHFDDLRQQLNRDPGLYEFVKMQDTPFTWAVVRRLRSQFLATCGEDGCPYVWPSPSPSPSSSPGNNCYAPEWECEPSPPPPSPSPSPSASPTPPPPPAPTTVFADGFESGNFSNWTYNTGLVAQQQERYSGSWAARGTTTSATRWAYKTLSTNYTELYYRIRFKFLSQGSSTNVNVLKFRTASGTSILGLYRHYNGNLGYRNDVAGAATTSTTPVSLGTWHTVQVRVRINGASGETETWLDGVRIASLSKTENFATTPIGRVQIGENSYDRIFDVAIDDVVASTGLIGQ